MISDQAKIRCAWVRDPLSVVYHDKEWGVPVHDDAKLFEFLILEGAQAGLSWLTILQKRDNYRKAFDNFDVKKIARYDTQKVFALLANEGIIRNRLKISATIQNAKAFLAVQQAFGSFDAFIWHFVRDANYPTKTAEAEAISKDLLKRGFKFVGPTICYAFMQAVGLMNDHQLNCFRHNEVAALRK